MQERKDVAVRAQDHGLEHIPIAPLPGRAFPIPAKALTTFLLNGAINNHRVPMVEEARTIEGPPLQKLPNHAQGDLLDLVRIHPAGMAFGVIRAGHSGVTCKARVLGGLSAEQPHVPGSRIGIAKLVEGIAGTGSEQIGGQNLPPDMGGQIEAHLLGAGVGQLPQPAVQGGERPAHHAHYALGGGLAVNRRLRLAARWFATWP